MSNIHEIHLHLHLEGTPAVTEDSDDDFFDDLDGDTFGEPLQSAEELLKENEELLKENEELQNYQAAVINTIDCAFREWGGNDPKEIKDECLLSLLNYHDYIDLHVDWEAGTAEWKLTDIGRFKLRGYRSAEELGDTETLTGTYIGKMLNLRGKRVLIRLSDDPSVVLVQFDEIGLLRGETDVSHGWHSFYAGDFEIQSAEELGGA